MSDTVLFGGLIVMVALGIAVTLALGRIAFALFKDLRANRQPKLKLKLEGFGEAEFDEHAELWTGKLNGETSPLFAIAGKQDGPDPELLNRMKNVALRINQLNDKALTYLSKTNVPGKFDLLSVDFLWEKRPNSFALAYELSGDLDGVWRVEFEGDTPVSTSRDD